MRSHMNSHQQFTTDSKVSPGRPGIAHFFHGKNWSFFRPTFLYTDQADHKATSDFVSRYEAQHIDTAYGVKYNEVTE